MAFEVFDVVMERLHKKMKFESMAHEVVTHNIANANNKDFVPLRFDEELQKAVRKGNAQGVVLEEEMEDLAKHSSKYGAYIKLLMMKMADWRTIVTQGRK